MGTEFTAVIDDRSRVRITARGQTAEYRN